MEKFRCPTCLTMLEGGELRCPACRSRLRKRGQPIVLGDRNRITSLPALPAERDLQARAQPSITLDETHPRSEPSPAAEARPLLLVDLTTEPESSRVGEVAPYPWPSVPLRVEPVLPVDGDVHELFEALHRKARAQDENTSESGSLEHSLLGSGALRLRARRAAGRRRRGFEFLTRQSDQGTEHS
jgi:hypothetical protein